MARLRARTYAYLIGIGTPILLAGVLWWFRRQGGQAAPTDQLFALVVGAAMLGTAGILLKRSLPTLGASLALLVLGFPQEILGMVILPSGGLYLIAAFIVGLTDVGEMVGEGIEAGREGMEESGMNAPEMPSTLQDATDGGETEPADATEQEVPDAEVPEGPAQPVEADDVAPIPAGDDVGDETGAGVSDADGGTGDDAGETPDPEAVVEEHGPHHAPEVQVDQNRMHADDPSVGQIDGGDADEVADGDAAETDVASEDAGDGDTAVPTDAEAGKEAGTGEHAGADEYAGADARTDDDPSADESNDEAAAGTPVERPGAAGSLDDPETAADAAAERPDDGTDEQTAESDTSDETQTDDENPTDDGTHDERSS